MKTKHVRVIAVIVAVLIVMGLAQDLSVWASRRAEAANHTRALAVFRTKVRKAPLASFILPNGDRVEYARIPNGQGTNWVIVKGGFDLTTLSSEKLVILGAEVAHRNGLSAENPNWQVGQRVKVIQCCK